MLPQPLLPPPAAAPTGGQEAEAVRIAVVIPAWSQPVLLTEALESVLAQAGAPPTAAVVVDDGCPFPATWHTASAYAAAWPGRVHVLRRRNGGLSAARNTGVEFALAAFPGLEAVYFLDADNRLHPHFLARAHAALAAAPAEVGWVYPDFDMFGEQRNYSVAGEFALLPLLHANFCEAGSLVKAELLAKGLRFDESFRQGFEDWDFFLAAANLGYRGQHLPLAGFQYRRRPESMLRASERIRPQLVEQLRQKYRERYLPRRLAALEAEERPRFAYYDSDSGTIALRHDPDETRGGELPAGELRRRFVAALEAPNAAWFPEFFCFADGAALAVLRRFGLARAVFWHAERLLRQFQFVAVEVVLEDRPLLAVRPGGDAAGRVAQAPLIFAQHRIMVECALDPGSTWLETLAGPEPRPLVTLLRVVLPRRSVAIAPTSRAPLKQLMLEVSALGAALARRTRLPTDWHQDFRCNAATVPWQLRKELGIGATPPRRPKPGVREIGFLMPMFSFAGTEKVVQNQAAAFRARGWRTHLIIAGAEEMELGSGTVEAFDSITLFTGLGETWMDWRDGYLGIGTSALSHKFSPPDALGALVGLDVVLNTHAPGMNALMAQLRRHGTRTYAGLHVMEISRWGQPIGNPHFVIPYEYAYDGFTVISEQLRDWCVAQGIPEGKLHLVRNAPAFAVPEARLRAAIATRRRRTGRLRVLSLGRLDQQKGIDRLAAMAERSAGLVEWRIIGKPVLADQAMPCFPVRLEPAAVTAAELDALYAWADVVVLPSRYEGVPLTILEAQRFGCAVIATEVGAVAEIVTDGVDGLLVPHEGESEHAIVAAFVHHIERLAGDRAEALALGEAAAARLARADWADNLADFFRHLETVLPRDILA